ncbi:uncharacterized protein N7484_008215 [Penicillium longicatenatum]|uniref:uncharacterized protein n=1 Tax=Penicillium longicatenatum TaxID=1561947 RepID=UPI0025497814|nr:uncharacterized protein N7484_008215 [Penicillium longicatenatum]KAJ5640353.1 hypothetical protein N7484_008215 [Penicillium longicatenatum]
MSLYMLPAEIISLVADRLVSINDLYNFLQARREFYNLLIWKLYQRNVKDDGGSALVWYSRHGQESGVRNMLAAGANVNLREPGPAQTTALLESVHHNHIRVVQFLLENGALPNTADIRSRRPLILAMNGRSDVAITKLLLDYGSTANPIPLDKRPPLLEAIRSNQESKVALLLKHGADPHITEGRGAMNLLHVASAKNAVPAILKMLIGVGIAVDSHDGFGRTPLQVAADHSCVRAVRVLLQHGANPNYKNINRHSEGRTALFYAVSGKSARHENKTIIRMLVMHGAEVNSKNCVQQTPLLYAVSRGAIKQAQALLENGADIMAKNSNNETVVHLAISLWGYRPDMLSWLIETGADMNWIGGKYHETPIFYAIRHFDERKGIESARKILSLGVDIHFRNSDGLTPLSLAVSMCSIEWAELLLGYGALVNSKDMQGRSPLHHIAETKLGSASKVQAIVSLLIRHGADVNSRDCSGYTPLHRVVAKEWIWGTVGELLKAGADRCAMSHDGKFPYDMVPAGPWAETQCLFLRHYPV